MNEKMEDLIDNSTWEILHYFHKDTGEFIDQDSKQLNKLLRECVVKCLLAEERDD